MARRFLGVPLPTDDLLGEFGDDRDSVVDVLDEIEWALDTGHPYMHYARRAMSVRASSAKIQHSVDERVGPGLGVRFPHDQQLVRCAGIPLECAYQRVAVEDERQAVRVVEGAAVREVEMQVGGKRAATIPDGAEALAGGHPLAHADGDAARLEVVIVGPHLGSDLNDHRVSTQPGAVHNAGL